MVQKSVLVAIEALELNSGLIDDAMKLRISRLLGNDELSISFDKFEPSELDALFTLVKTLQAKVVTNDGGLLSSTTTRDLTSLIGGITSLLRAFSVQQQKIDDAKEMGNLKEAVLAAIMILSTDAQNRFYTKLESFS